MWWVRLWALGSASILSVKAVVVASSDTETAVEVLTPGDVSVPWVVWLIIGQLGLGKAKQNHRRILHLIYLLLNSRKFCLKSIDVS